VISNPSNNNRTHIITIDKWEEKSPIKIKRSSQR
jgi:hypothetical protein